MGTTDAKGQVLISIKEVQEILGVGRTSVYRLINLGMLVKVKLPGKRAWLVTLDSVYDYKAAKGMTLQELSVRVLKLERQIRDMAKDAFLPGDSPARETHDPEEVQALLRKLHPEAFN